jgi:alpha-tubulin suppressor-like RCC1 family protein
MRTPALARRLTASGAILTALAVIPAAPAASAAAGRAAPKTVPAVVAWGDNDQGELGNDTTTSASTPVYVLLPTSQRFTTLRSGRFDLAVSAAGRLYAWGDNASGQLGDGTTTDRLKPERISLPAGVRLKTAREGGEFTLALTTGGKLLAWGYNGDGALGTGSTTNHHKPVWVKLPTGIKVTAISAGYNSALALTSTGRVLSWGAGLDGQLGNGTGTSRHVPGYVKLPRHTKITSIAAGNGTGYAVTTAGRLLAWGFNVYGELGDGTVTGRLTPVFAKLPRGVKVVAAVAGLIHALALTSGHKVLAWGSNSNGQLGTGSVVNHRKPVWVKLPAGTKVSALAAGEFFSMALTTRQHILTWGENNRGQLGDGTTADRHLPGRVHLPSGFTPTLIGAGFETRSPLAGGRQIPD